MLQTLRRIIQEVNTARDLQEALRIIVQNVQKEVIVDACTIYLANNSSQELVLMETEGLNPEAVGKVRLHWDQGLVGLVAERAEPVNKDNAPSHPRYLYFPETGEERYPSFLGVPIIHHRTVHGVLVVQSRASVHFDEDTVTFLVTIAAQLAGAIAHAEASGDIDILLRQGQVPDYRPLQGVSGAPGVAIGTVVVINASIDIESIADVQVTDTSAELKQFRAAVRAVRKDIVGMLKHLQAAMPATDSALFDAYLLMLKEGSLIDDTVKGIKAGRWAASALRDTVLEHVHLFEQMEDIYLRERAQDIRDLGRRVLEHLLGERQKFVEYPRNTVLISKEVTASMLAEVPPRRLVGVVSLHGSHTSHTAILARALGIPAVMGVVDLPLGKVHGLEIIADGYAGRVFINPSKDVRHEYKRLQKEEAELTAELQSLRNLPAETIDGLRIPLYANTGLLSDIRPSLKSGAEGVGLYRTEFPFMVRDRFPGEQEQYDVYRKVLESFAPRPVTMRTLDVGGDKALPYFPIKEDNPFLGWRGIRIMLDHPEIFLTQIRAMLRANAGIGNLSMLLPMISNLVQVDESLVLIHRAHEELLEDGVDVVMPRIGVMVEVPTAVFQADRLANRVDFLSVGTNDLTQYLLAVDRNNARVADLFDSLHPAVLRALVEVVEGASKYGKPVSVCGEMAGDPAAAILLLGMGMDSLSMSSSSLPRVKWAIRSIARKQAQALLGEVLEMEEPGQVRARLHQALIEAGVGSLLVAGKSV
ncbi:MAG: phosphoenolpyruvate--protein phosphotransferase [Thiohalomonadaceae bacterium]